MTIINETRVARAPQSIPNQVGNKVEGMHSGRADGINLYHDSFFYEIMDVNEFDIINPG